MRIFIGLAVLAMVAAPAWANMLDDSTGGFEDPWPSGPQWLSTKTGGILERDSTIWGPAPNAACGDHYGSVQSGGGGTYYGWLSSLTVPASETITLTGAVHGGTTNASADIWIQLLDGSNENSDVGNGGASEWVYNFPGTGGLAWTAFDPIVMHPTNQQSGEGLSHITIKFGITILSGWSEGTGIHLDCLNLTPEPASMALFALAGLPLLLRRRR